LPVPRLNIMDKMVLPPGAKAGLLLEVKGSRPN